MTCPRSTESGCRCVEHDPGLSAYARDPDAFEDALARCRPETTTIRIVTFGAPAETPCAGTLTCNCKRCVAERARRVERGAEGDGRASPFKVRRARPAKAA